MHWQTTDGFVQNNKALGKFCELTRGAFLWRLSTQQVPPLRSPAFLSRMVALANLMRLSLMKAAHVDLSDVAKQEFGFAPVGMTNLFGTSLVADLLSFAPVTCQSFQQAT
jgi:hypothetical protein